jgi:gliding motility-associated-like protein
MKRFRFFLFWVCFLTLSRIAFAQSSFQRTYDAGPIDEARALCLTGPNRAIMAGKTRQGSQEMAFFSEINEIGDVFWTKTLQIGTNSLVIQDVEADLNAPSVLLLGNGRSPNPNPGFSFWCVVDEQGEIINFQGTDMGVTLTNILALPDGYLLCGQIEKAGDSWPSICKVSKSGNLLWASNLKNSGLVGEFRGAWQDQTTGFIYGAGRVQATGSMPNDGLMACFDANGTLLWSKQVGTGTDAFFTSIIGLDAERLFWAGRADGALGQIWCLTTSTDGVVKSDFAYRSSDRSISPTDLILNGGNIVFTASASKSLTDNAPLLLSLNPNGDLLWNKTYQTGAQNNLLYQLKALPNQDLLSAGTRSLGGRDLLLVHTNSKGDTDGSCCPLDLDLSRTALNSSIEAVVPQTSHELPLLGYNYEIEDLSWESIELCKKIALDFSLSDSIVCPGECVQLSIDSSTLGVDYAFDIQGGQTDPADPMCIRALEEGVLRVTRKGDNGVCVQNLQKNVQIRAFSQETPNAFTPDGDKINDSFFPLLDCPVSNGSFEVFNRWGQRVHYSINLNTGWNGNYPESLKACPPDVYIWHLRYDKPSNKQKLQLKGEVTLIR